MGVQIGTNNKWVGGYFRQRRQIEELGSSFWMALCLHFQQRIHITEIQLQLKSYIIAIP
ncbi:hypothetical protein LguiB_006633 [Lonicera macranthoides]